MSEVLKKINCRKIGSIFSSAGNPLTYPFWILMKNKFEGNDINIVNLKIENYSKNFNNQNLNYDELCAIIDFNKLSIKVID